MKIVVIGGGAWGSALAASAARQATVQCELWCRDTAQADAMRATGENARYLPGVTLPASLAVHSADPGELVSRINAGKPQLVIVATPMSALRAMLRGMAACEAPVAWLCKGVEPAQEPGAYGLLGHEICAEELPNRPAGVLSGPSFAAEVAAGQPTALVAGSLDGHLRALLVEAFHGPSLRIYAREDVIGIEVGGAVKNVLAIATGLCDGLGLGLNARAALITRGLAEMTRFGVALGAQPETFMGLSGLGDLVLTATGGLSRNRRVGLLLAEGYSAAEAVASLGHVAEGVYCAYTVLQRAEALVVDMPITRAVVDVIQGRTDARAAAASLMEREPAPEARPSK